ncbi:MAG: cation transporter [Oscillospiraceae bacterium]|nr:cation transporter [Oscillospiraceae bacterium]
MKSERNILVAFILNLAFSVFEFSGGFFCGSVAILSDAIHDVGDAASIGIAYFLERKSKRRADEVYTYGYGRYSVLGGFITAIVLFLSSIIVIFNAVGRILSPVEINYNGMLIFAAFGFVVNFVAVMFTHKGHSINERAISLHLLEDVLGWMVVLIGALVMKFTDISLLDPVMSVAVAIFIIINAAKTAKKAIDLFLEKAPSGVDAKRVEECLEALEGVLSVGHIHIWSFDEKITCATLHITSNTDTNEVKERIRKEMERIGISHVTIEIDCEKEKNLKNQNISGCVILAGN